MLGTLRLDLALGWVLHQTREICPIFLIEAFLQTIDELFEADFIHKPVNCLSVLSAGCREFILEQLFQFAVGLRTVLNRELQHSLANVSDPYRAASA